MYSYNCIRKFLRNFYCYLFITCVYATPAMALEKRITIPLALPVNSSSASADNLEKSAQSSSSIRSPAEILFPIPMLNTPEKISPHYLLGDELFFVPEFEKYVASKIAPNVPAVAIAIVANGEVQSLRVWGVKQMGKKEKATPDSIFRLASVSKTLASTAAAILVNQGKIRWDTPVLSLLPGVKFKNNQYGKLLTLKHILSQSTGLPKHAASSSIEADSSYGEAVKRLRNSRFLCAPGRCYAYQNVTFSLAGEMMEKKSGETFEQFVKHYLFDPLGMKNASYGLSGYLATANRTAPHIRRRKSWQMVDVTENYYRIAPAAGANASIADMSQFLLAQLGKRQDILPELVLNQLHTRATENTPMQNHYSSRQGVYNTAYGLGWRVFDYGPHKNFVHHGGWVKGFRSEIIFNRDLQMGMVFLTNSETRMARDVIFKFLDMHERAYKAAHPTVK
jgi:beta-lactamase class C